MLEVGRNKTTQQLKILKMSMLDAIDDHFYTHTSQHFKLSVSPFRLN